MGSQPVISKQKLQILPKLPNRDEKMSTATVELRLYFLEAHVLRGFVHNMTSSAHSLNLTRELGLYILKPIHINVIVTARLHVPRLSVV